MASLGGEGQQQGTSQSLAECRMSFLRSSRRMARADDVDKETQLGKALQHSRRAPHDFSTRCWKPRKQRVGM